MIIGESRTELLQWLNSTLDLDYTKVEQCGTGAAFCQLMDSIVGGIPMAKVRFNASTEYDYRHNLKILQASFTKHGITKVIDVEKLIKCRLQDNLDLLQWLKRFWIDNKGNDIYDAKSKRKVSGIGANSNINRAPGSRNVSGSSLSSRRTTVSSSSAPTSRRVSSTGRTSLPPNTPQMGNTKTSQLQKELNDAMNELANVNEELQEYKISVESLETERNFYFNKLREIEILAQNVKDLHDANSEEVNDLTVFDFTTKIQTILYSTEEGFQSNVEDPTSIDAESF